MALSGALSASSVPYSSRHRSRLDPLFLGVVLLVPWMPPPTASGPEKFVVPLVLFVIVASFVLWTTAQGSAPLSVPRRRYLILATLSILGIYSLRFVVRRDFGELLFFLGRAAMLIGFVTFVHWMGVSRVEISRVQRVFTFGFVALSVLIIFKGVTGFAILGAPDPPRPLGFNLPLYKNNGLLRSAGELGIMATIAWSYLLVFRHTFRRSHWWTMSLLVLGAIIVSQSRNVYLASASITVLHVGFRLFRTNLIGGIAIVGATFAAFILEVLLPWLRDTAIGALFIGQQTFEANVDNRVLLDSIAVDTMISHPVRSLLGISHSEFYALAEAAIGGEVTIHNGLLSNLLFLGWIAGGATLAIYYAGPGIRLLRESTLRARPEAEAVFLALIGTIMSQNFYEGFFSLSLMLVLALCWTVAYRSLVPGGTPMSTVPTSNVMEST